MFFLDQLSNAVILTDLHGHVIYANGASRKLLLKLTSSSEISSIEEIDPKFVQENIMKKNTLNKEIYIKKLKFSVTVQTISFNGTTGFAYIFEESILTSRVFDEVIECIDDIIIIANEEGRFEKGNKAIDRLLGYNHEDLVGMNDQEVIDEYYTKDKLTQEVVDSKQKKEKIIKYSNGKTIMYTGIPSFNDAGDLTKAILTGRDVSNLIKLEEELKISEQLKDKYYHQVEELEKYRELDKIIYSSNKMEKLLNIAIRVAKSESAVFITGESGVGKEEIAKLIHRNSLRKDKPFITINCAAIPSELLESELFGYEEGSFTGAQKGGKRGLFEEADGGTVFLDEIGELPTHMQSKLLRVIQENRCMHIGGKKTLPIDARYICATNLSKEQLSNNKKFRQDLYYRLSVVPIRVPPLRERKEDVFPLVKHFLGHFNEKYKRDISISKKVMQKLYSYNWPGNVRELKNIVERLVILAESQMINESEYDITTRMGDDNSNMEDKSDIQISRLMDLNEAYRIVDEVLIKKALEERGSIVKAAKALGIDPSTIHRKIKKGYDVR